MSRAALPSRWPTATVVGSSGSLAVLDVSPPAEAVARRPVLFVPGFTGSKEDFASVLDGLAAVGHRAVAMDQRGQFESDGPDDPAAYTSSALAEDLRTVSMALGLGRAHLVGHSLGGLVARAAVLAHPSAWASLTLLDSSGPAALSGDRRGSTDALGLAARTVGLPELWDAVTAFWAAQGHASPPPAAAAFQRERFLRSTPAALVGMSVALAAEPDLVDELRAAAAAVGLPVHVVFGEYDDAWLPAEQRVMADRLGTPAIVVPDAVHSPAVEAPEATVAALTTVFAAAEALGVS